MALKKSASLNNFILTVIFSLISISCQSQRSDSPSYRMAKPIKILDNSKHNAFPSIEMDNNGRLLIGYRSSISHLSPIAKACLLISSDMGSSWSEEIELDNGKDFFGTQFGIRGVNLSRLKNKIVAIYHVNNGDYGNTYYRISKGNYKNWSKRKKIELENTSVNKISCEGQMIEENLSYILPVFLGDKNNLLDVGVAVAFPKNRTV